MKLKIITLSLILAALSTTANAQENETEAKNVFLGIGVGGMTVLNDGINSPTANFNISIGKYLTPTWGVRLQGGGFWQSLQMQDRGYERYCKRFIEANFDGMINVTNLLGGYNPNRLVDFSIFAGPTVNFASGICGILNSTNNFETTITTTPSYNGGTVTNKIESQTSVTTTNTWRFAPTEDLKTRIGATFGFDLGFNCSSKWAINLEGRFGVAPSIFGQGSDCYTREATVRMTVGAIYTFGGKNLKKKTIVKEVVKEIVKEVPVARNDKNTNATTAVVTPTPISSAVFFKIGSSALSDEGKVQIQLTAKAIKANPDAKFVINAYADKNTGSASFNQRLTEKRAEAVYDALIAEGVKASQLEKVANGGVGTMFGADKLTRVTIMETK